MIPQAALVLFNKYNTIDSKMGLLEMLFCSSPDNCLDYSLGSTVRITGTDCTFPTALMASAM